MLRSPPSFSAKSGKGRKAGLRFTDKDEHMYFWFPLLAGLSELTFDPRADIRCAAAVALRHPNSRPSPQHPDFLSRRLVAAADRRPEHGEASA